MNILLTLIRKDFFSEIRSGRFLIAIGTAITLTAIAAIGAEQAMVSAELQTKLWPTIMAMIFLAIAEQLLHGSFSSENTCHGNDNLLALKTPFYLILIAKLLLFSMLIFTVAAIAQVISIILVNLPLYYLGKIWILFPLSIIFTALFIPISFYLSLNMTGRQHGVILLIILPLFLPSASAYITYLTTGELAATTPILISMVTIVLIALAVCSRLRRC